MDLALHAETDADGNRDAAGRELAELVAGHAADHPDVTVATAVTSGAAEDLLLEAAQQASLLVVARPRRAGSEAWRRSVARSLIGRTACPLAIVPSLGASTEPTAHVPAATAHPVTSSAVGWVRAW